MKKLFGANPSSPIGIMDSGAGGLSVLQHIRRTLPNESLIYVADSAHIPYGDKTPAFVRERVNAIADTLVAMGVKALVVACNTATAAAVESLRERLQLPVVGMEPGIKPAVQDSRSGVVGILATEGMVRSRRMASLVERFAADREVVIQACPGLVEQVERQALETPETVRLLQRYLKPLLERGADTLVLGCTHYPFLRNSIERLVGPGVRVIDTGEAVARRLQQLLQEHGLQNTSGPSILQLYASRKDDAQRRSFSALLGEVVEIEALPQTIAAEPLDA